MKKNEGVWVPIILEEEEKMKKSNWLKKNWTLALGTAGTILIMIALMCGCWLIPDQPPVEPPVQPPIVPPVEPPVVPPVVPPASGIVLKIPFDNQTYGKPWIDKGGDLMVLTFWQKPNQPEYKALEVWKNSERPAELLWSDQWEDSRPFSNGGRGPVAVADFGGQDGSELVLVRWEAGRFMLRLLRGASGSIIREIQIPKEMDITNGPMAIHPCNISHNRGNAYSDVVVTWNDKAGDTVRVIRCYRASDLSLVYEHRVEDGTRHNSRWSTPEGIVIRNWPGGRDGFWRGGGVLDQFGGGGLGLAGYNNSNIEVLLANGDDIPNPDPWSSAIFFGTQSYPVLIAATGSEISRCPKLYDWCKPNNGPCYFEYRRNKVFVDPSQRSLFDLRKLSQDDFLCSAYFPPSKYRGLAIDRHTMKIVSSLNGEDTRPLNRIQWNGEGNHEILGIGGVYDSGFKLIAKRKGNFSLGNRFCFDVNGDGREEYAFLRTREGKREVVFIR